MLGSKFGTHSFELSLDLFARNGFTTIQLIESDFDLPTRGLKIGWNCDCWPNQNTFITLFGNEKPAVLQAVAPPGCGRQHDGPTAANLTGVLNSFRLAHGCRISDCPHIRNSVILKTALAINRKERKDLIERNLGWFRTKGLIHLPGEWKA